MAFSTFSKEFTANMFTEIENQFITKYLPQAEGDAVKVYLYGLYLCSCAEEFDAAACAKLLKLTPARLLEIFEFWEECDLVHILSREPLFVQYLPVNSAIGKPKPIRTEKYTEFNRELYKIMNRVGKEFKPYEMERIFRYLEDCPMEPQAFLLVVEYCAKKDGADITANHVLNKAKKLEREHKFTYEQVSAEFEGYNAHEKELTHVFNLLGIYKKPQEEDYAILEKWLAAMDLKAIYACAAALKKGSLATLDTLIGELIARNITAGADAEAYLTRRKTCAEAVYAVARKLGVKVQNPRSYCEEYAEKWLERGYDEESLSLLASLAFKLGYGFGEFDTLLENTYARGIVDLEGVKEYCAQQNKELQFLKKVQSACGNLKITKSALDMLETWLSWNSTEALILEAASRANGAAAPLPYMNKILSEWKRAGVKTVAQIPERQVAQPLAQLYKNEAAIAADERSAREEYYAVRRNRAERKAAESKERAERDEEFQAADREIRVREVELARAEVYAPETAGEITEKIKAARLRRAAAMKKIGVTEADFLPVYTCKKCSDTGFLPDGRACDCYKK